MKISLRKKINYTILITFAVIAALFIAVQVPFQKRNLKLETDNVKLLLQTLVERDEEELANEIFDDRIKALQIRVKEISALDGIICTCIFDKSGNLLASNNEDLPDQQVTKEYLVEIAKHPQVKTFGFRKQKVLVFSKLLIFLGDHTGFVLIHYSLEKLIKNQTTSVLIFVSLMIMTLVIMLILFNLILSKAILEPILNLVNSSKAIVQGNYDRTIQMSQSDEVGKLSKSFDQMRQAVKEKISDVERMKEKYRDIIENMQDVYFRVDMDGKIVMVSPSAYESLGYDAKNDNLIGMDMLKNFYVFPEKRKPMLGILKKEKKIPNHEIEVKKKDGTTITVITSLALYYDKKGRPAGIEGLFKDISYRKKAEMELENNKKKLLESQQMLQLVMDTIPQFIFWKNQDCVYLGCNKNFASVAGVGEPENIIGKTDYDLAWKKEEAEFFIKYDRKVMDHNKAELHLVEPQLQADGKQAWLDTSKVPIRDDQGNVIGLLGTYQDITEQKQLEAHLQQAQKMEAIGTLAGGIAHDFNNILSGIFGYSQMAQSHIKNPEKANKHIEQIIKGAQRATDLTKQILTFSRQSEYQKHPFKIYLEIKEALKLLRSSIPSTIEIKNKLYSRKMVLADPIKIHQLIMNLCTNAYHSMRKTGGNLTVSLTDVEILESSFFKGKKRAPGEYIKLEVSDTGHGMDKKTLERIFEPYYTTKKKGDGTGLGLALVQAIVEEHDGFMEIDSAPAKGTTFFIYFPIIREETKEDIQKIEKESQLTGNEHILVVDDEDPIRKSYQALLENYGYQIQSFSNSLEAFETFKTNPSKFDLVITDMTMPGLTGDKLASEILKMKPDIPIILCTGYSENISQKETIELGIKKFIQKPILNQDLVLIIREILDK